MAKRRFTREMTLKALDAFVGDILDRNPDLFAPDWNLKAHVNTPTITCEEARRIVGLRYSAANEPTPTYEPEAEADMDPFIEAREAYYE